MLAGGPVLLALSRTVPNAVRLARAILRDHVVCSAGILTLLVLWLAHLGR